MTFKLSQRAQQFTSSAIRELLKATSSSEVISFAGGTPAPETFPVDLMRAASEHVLSTKSREALQYSPTEGFLPLRQWIADKHGTSAECVMITTGSQQALDLLAKAFIDPGSPVALESPTYLGALQAFSLFEPDYRALPCDDSGVITESLSLSNLYDIKMAYLMPNYQNPTGRSISLSRRHELCQLMGEAGVWIIEDDPYGELSFDNSAYPSLHSIYPEGVAYLGSFSKVLAPGLRVGYVVAPCWLTNKLVQLKQAADLHTSSLDQLLFYEVIVSGGLKTQIPNVRTLYKNRCNAMLKALSTYMPEGVRWTIPQGGMFIWLELPEGVDANVLLSTALSGETGVRVAFVPGSPFFAGQARSNTARLSFAAMEQQRMEIGIRQLAQLIRAH